MFKAIAVRALLGTGAIGAIAAGGGAVAVTPNLAAAISPSAPGASGVLARTAADVRHGVVIKLSDTQVTIERQVRDRATGAVTRDDVTFQLTPATKVYRAGDRTAVGHDALKLGERVRVRFAEANGQKVARRVVILRDMRVGKVIARGNDYLVLHTAKHGDVRVVVTDGTTYFTGRGTDRKPGSFAAIKVGDRAAAFGEEDSAHNFDAVRVHYAERTDPRRATGGAASAAVPAQ